MKYMVLNIDTGEKNGEFTPTLSCYLPDNSVEINIDRKHKSIVICPGGGYAFTSDREAEPVALKFLSAGFNCFVLRYSVTPAVFPTSLLELSKAMAIIREHSDEWNVATDDITVCGFSAGGHLAASLATLWDKDFITESLGIKFGQNKPNKAVLCYPVISSGEYGHIDSIKNLLGDKFTQSDLFELVSLENQVSINTPPTFLWHTCNDDCVPVENSLLMAMSLKKHNIPMEMHIYSQGVHGLALCNKNTAAEGADYCINPACESWIDMAIDWINRF